MLQPEEKQHPNIRKQTTKRRRTVFMYDDLSSTKVLPLFRSRLIDIFNADILKLNFGYYGAAITSIVSIILTKLEPSVTWF